jgi:glyoxylase-like metal-dependent hydrolase (beta-lactamase superfamily II)/ferredoxin
VDSTCINCGVSRHYAPDIFGDSGEHAYVRKQPEGAAEELLAMQALLACPTGSIGVRERHGLMEAMESFPLPMAPGIYLNGFNHRDSYGAHSYFIQSEAGNWLIDSPRFIPHLVHRFDAMGGIRYIFLTHSDDVADAQRYAQRFAAERIIHRYDAHAQPDAERILEQERDYPLADGQILYTPGHTKGHTVLLWQDKYLFTGDHFAWLPRLHRFGSFKDFCWHSWEQQIQSVERLQIHDHVEWVFPGHGKWAPVASGKFPQIVREAVAWMKTAS